MNSPVTRLFIHGPFVSLHSCNRRKCSQCVFFHCLDCDFHIGLHIVFSFNRWESVKSFINGLGKLSVQYILNLHAIKFYYHLLHVANTVLNGLFWLHFEDFYDKDDCLHHIMALGM